MDRCLACGAQDYVPCAAGCGDEAGGGAGGPYGDQPGSRPEPLTAKSPELAEEEGFELFASHAENFNDDVTLARMSLRWLGCGCTVTFRGVGA
jgi:hypothetical protein